MYAGEISTFRKLKSFGKFSPQILSASSKLMEKPFFYFIHSMTLRNAMNIIPISLKNIPQLVQGLRREKMKAPLQSQSPQISLNQKLRYLF